MIKKQVGFQVASYQYPQEYFAGGNPAMGSKHGKVRQEVEGLQASGWEVIKTEVVLTLQDEGVQRSYNMLVSLVKYEYVPEPINVVDVKMESKDIDVVLDSVRKDVEDKKESGTRGGKSAENKEQK